MQVHEFEQAQQVRRPREEVFEFFARARNLERITPPWLHFRILNRGEVEMREGARIDYRLRLHGLSFRWQSVITAWEPPHRFVDEQSRGPYRLWRHEHTFEGAGETVVRDRVRYAVWGPEVVRRMFVAPQLEKIFDHRRERISELLELEAGIPATHAGSAP